MLLSEVVGLEDVKRQLLSELAQGRVSHATLLAAEPGVGAYAVALGFASALMCRHRTAAGDACGECPECYKMARMEHPDVHFVFPVNDAKTNSNDKPTSDKYITQWREYINVCEGYPDPNEWYKLLGIENKQGVIRREESAEIVRKLSLKSFEGGAKVVIMYLPETMRDEAANTLLKLIEEPPAGTYFLFVTYKPDRVLGTILSRTQRITIPGQGEQVIADAMVAKLGMEPAKALTIAHSAQGSWGAARNMATQNDSSEIYEVFVSLMRLCYASNYLGIFEWVDKVAGYHREFHKTFCVRSLELLRDCYMRQLDMEKLDFSSPDLKGFVEKFAPFVNHHTIERFVQEFTLLLRDVTQNGNTKILFTHFAMTLCKIFAQARQQMAK